MNEDETNLFPPSIAVLKLMDEHQLSHEELKEHLGMNDALFQAFMEDDVPITTELAEKLELLLGCSKEWWLATDAYYRSMKLMKHQQMIIETLCNLLVNHTVPISLKDRHVIMETLKKFGLDK